MVFVLSQGVEALVFYDVFRRASNEDVPDYPTIVSIEVRVKYDELGMRLKCRIDASWSIRGQECKSATVRCYTSLRSTYSAQPDSGLDADRKEEDSPSNRYRNCS